MNFIAKDALTDLVSKKISTFCLMFKYRLFLIQDNILLINHAEILYLNFEYHTTFFCFFPGQTW